MKKIFKRGLCIVLATAVAAMSAIGVFGAETDMVPEIYSNGFETDKMFDDARATLTDSGSSMRGKVLCLVPDESSAWMGKTFAINSSEYLISFDIKAGQTDHVIQLMMRDTAGKDFGHISLDAYNNFVISQNGEATWKLDGSTFGGSWINGGRYGTDWHNVTIMIKPDAGDTKLDYYIDGELVCNADTSFQNLTGETGILKNLYILPAGKTDGSEITEKFYLDNFHLSYAHKEYLTGSAKLSDERIILTMSEPVEGGLSASDISLVEALSGEEISFDAERNGTGMVIVPQSALQPETEYTVVLPENLLGATGKKLFSNRISFITPAGESEGIQVGSTLKSFNYEDLALGQVNNMSFLRPNYGNSTHYFENIYCVETLDKNNETTRAIKYTTSTSSNVMMLEGDGARFNDSESEDIVIASLDIMRENIQRTPNIEVKGKQSGEVVLGRFFLDSYGNFVALNANGESSDEDTDHGNGESYSAKHIVYDANCTAGRWNRITVVFNKRSPQKLVYYFDGHRVGEATAAAASKFFGFRVSGEMVTSGRVLYVDNFSIGYPVSNAKVTHFRLIDRNGNFYGAGETAAPVDIRSGRIYLNAEIDDSSIDVNKIVLKNESNVNILKNPVYNSALKCIDFEVDVFLDKNSEYVLTVDGLLDSGEKPLAAYMASLKTTALGELIMLDYGFYNGAEIIDDISDISAGDTLTLKAKFINTWDEDTSFGLSAAVYSENVMLDSDKQSFVITGTDNFTEKEQEFSVSVDASSFTNGQLMGVRLNESGRPEKDAIVFGSPSFTADAWSLEFSDKTTANKAVFCEVKAPSGSARDTVYRGAVVSGADGSFEVNVKLTQADISGWYKLEWIDENGTDGEKELLFGNIEEAKTAVIDINNAVRDTVTDKTADITAIAGVIDQKQYAFAITNQSFDTLSKTQIAEIVYAYIEKNGLFGEAAEDMPLVMDVVKRAVEVVAIDAGQAVNLFENAKLFDLANSRIKDFYNKYYVTEAMQKLITANLKNGGYKTFESFYTILTEKFVLAAVAAPDGIDNVKELIQEFSGADEIGTGKTGKDSAYRAVMNNTYGSYAELKLAFDTANADGPGSGSGDGGSSAGSNKANVGEMTINSGAEVQGNESLEIPKPVFSDIEGVPWAKDAITYLAEKKILNGKGDYRFCPDDKITREELAKIIVLAFEYDSSNSANSGFADISDWAKKYVDCAFENGIVKGLGNKVFGAKDYITRQDLAVMIYRAAVNADFDFDAASENTFTDDNIISDYARDAVNALYNAGIINGTGNGEFSPLLSASRAEAAKIIYSILQN